MAAVAIVNILREIHVDFLRWNRQSSPYDSSDDWNQEKSAVCINYTVSTLTLIIIHYYHIISSICKPF